MARKKKKELMRVEGHLLELGTRYYRSEIDSLGFSLN